MKETLPTSTGVLKSTYERNITSILGSVKSTNRFSLGVEKKNKMLI